MVGGWRKFTVGGTVQYSRKNCIVGGNVQYQVIIEDN